MKKLILLFSVLSSTQAFALPSDYSCEVGRYHIDLTLTDDQSTHIWLIDQDNHTVIFQGYAKAIERKDEFNRYYFYTPEGEAVVVFDRDDVLNRPWQLWGRIRATVEGFILHESFRCQK